MNSNKLAKSLSITLQDPDQDINSSSSRSDSNHSGSDFDQIPEKFLLGRTRIDPIPDSLLSPPSPLYLDGCDMQTNLDNYESKFMEEYAHDPFEDDLQLFGFAAKFTGSDMPFCSRDAQETIAIIQAVAWATENAFDENLVKPKMHSFKEDHHDSPSSSSFSSWINHDYDCDPAVQTLAASTLTAPVAVTTSPHERLRMQRLVSHYDESSKIASFQKSPSLLQLQRSDSIEEGLDAENGQPSPSISYKNADDDSGVVPICSSQC